MVKCNIRRLMADNKIDKITVLMRKSNLSRSAIERLYKEKNMEKTNLETLIKLCNTFNCKLSDLLEYTPDTNAQVFLFDPNKES